jgi:hypothetical protein
MDMNIADVIKLACSIIGSVIAIFGVAKWLINVKIKPLEDQNTALSKKNSEQDLEIQKLKDAFIEELREISSTNYEFRREYENGLSDVKLLLSESYVKKEDFQKETTDIHGRIDVSHDIKVIKEAMKDLNS